MSDHRNFVPCAFIGALTLALLGLNLHPALSAPDKAQYELQERCGKRASEVFGKDHPQSIENVDGGQAISSYRNHYNQNLNKCFMLHTTIYIGKKNGIVVSWKDELIIDINDNKEYGNLFENTVDSKGVALMPNDNSGLIACSVIGLRCVSESQWRQMIGSYMGDRD